MIVATEPAAGTIPAAGFLSAPLATPDVERLYAGDLAGGGYVARLTRLWAHDPRALDSLTELVSPAEDADPPVIEMPTLTRSCWPKCPKLKRC